MRYKVFFLLFLCLFLTGCQAQQSNLDNETMHKRQEDPFNEKLTSRLKCQLDPLKNAVLKFYDPVIEAETRKILKKPEGDILIKYVLAITALENHGNISTLTDLKWFTNLKSIILRNCNIKSLEGIEHLLYLKKIDVGYNNISNLDPVSNLINLEILKCNGNNISNIDPVSSLINLEKLDCENNNISSLDPVSSLINLKRLDCRDNNISSLDPVSSLINLERLNCDNNNISNLDPLSNLINLERLDCDNNNISNLGPLSNLINLKELFCAENNIRDYSALSGLINLEKLSIGDNGVSRTDIAIFENLTKLKRLYAPWCGIDDISVLSHMPDLEILSMYNNNISDINCLKNLHNLINLNLKSNQIRDVSAIENFDQLESVYLGDNPIPIDSLLKFFDSIGLEYAVSNQSVKINSKMPEFGIETLSYFKDKYYRVQTVTITDNSTGEILQTIFIPELSFSGDTEIIFWYNNILTFEDLNFDGYTDIRLYDFQNGNYLTDYIFLVWEPELGLYQNDRRLNVIPFASFNQEEQLIYGMSRGSAASHWYHTYKYIDGEPTLIYLFAECIISYSNNIPAYLEAADIDMDEKDVMVFHEVVTELNEETGEMETTRDEYVFYPDSDYLDQDAIIAIFDASSEIGKMISADQ